MFLLLIFFNAVCTLNVFTIAATVYDQSQTGELNVQVELKDLQIIALMKNGKEEYVDYDYAYDYSEMTIKPQNGTTPKPFNVSSSTHTDVLKDNITTIGTTAFAETTVEPVKNSTGQSLGTVTVTEHSIINESTTPTKIVVENTTKTEFSEITVAPVHSSTNGTICKKGFILNQKGSCEFKLQSASNALLKIIKLSQKLKRRENRKDKAQQ
ncbi:unnamed protein product [Diatraea saccharalis]|uniref:Uncharacterized protein n=1 Tax=Diatraea saccharalis TaxID=40085 RepID=A0A9N9W5N6_9NEOP|nr:unnamed protein product [Diatraea saccharalis]